MSKNLSYRPIILTANSSFYLLHYRKLLIKILNKRNKVVTISPVDSHSKSLSKYSVYLPWKIDRSKDRNPYSFLISLLRMFFLVRAIKPKLIHSHTLRTNLIIAIVCFFYNIPCVLSFTGLGILSKDKSSNLLFKIIIKTIIFFSIHERKGLLKLEKTFLRSRFIFQNSFDKEAVSAINKGVLKISNIIFGSGIPKEFFTKNKIKHKSNRFKNNQSDHKIEFIYCARLLISKGIKTFLKLASMYPEHNFIIFGAIDSSSKDCIKDLEFLNLCKNKNIKFKGYRKDPLLTSDFKNPVLIVPSYYGEGLPRAILEAFSLRIPVISSLPATINLFSKEELYIVKYKEIINYQLTIKEFLTDLKNGKVEEKINNAYKLSKKFTEHKIVMQTNKVYDQLI